VCNDLNKFSFESVKHFAHSFTEFLFKLLAIEGLLEFKIFVDSSFYLNLHVRVSTKPSNTGVMFSLKLHVYAYRHLKFLFSWCTSLSKGDWSQ